jgi:hypothetical protein
VTKVHNKPIKDQEMVQTKRAKDNPKALWSSTPDSVRCTRALEAELFTFGKFRGRSAIIHRTVQWVTGQCPVHTGLSGVPTEQQLLRAQRSTATHYMRACARRGQRKHSWRTGQSTRPVRCTTGQPRGPTSQSSNGRTPTVCWCAMRQHTSNDHFWWLGL